MADSKPEIVDSASSRTRPMTDAEFDKWLPAFLRRYLTQRLEAKEIVTVADKFPEMKHEVVARITDPTLASVIAAYVSLRSQEKQAEDSRSFHRSQARTNLILQLLIIGLAALSVFTSIVSLINH